MGNSLGDIAVVGEDEEAFGVFIEAAGAEEFEVLEFFGEDGEDGFFVFVEWVFVGAEETFWFVHGEGDGGGGGDRFEEFAVKFDSVLGWDGFIADGSDFAVDGDEAVADEGFSFTAGG